MPCAVRVARASPRKPRRAPARNSPSRRRRAVTAMASRAGSAPPGRTRLSGLSPSHRHLHVKIRPLIMRYEFLTRLPYMLKTKVVIEPQDVEGRLAEFGIERQDLIRIALSALAARNDSVLDDPKTAKGQFSYIHGVRAMRQAFCPAGYERISKQNIESVYD